MPGGTEAPPKTYARLVARELVAIAKLNERTSGRQLAEWMRLSEKYIRDRIGDNPTRSFTLTDIVNFSRLARIRPEEFLGDPSGVRRMEAAKIQSNVIEVSFGVGGLAQDQDDLESVAKKRSRDRGEQPEEP
jgi:hypothetical protein